MIGSIAGLVLAAVLVIVLTNKGDDPKPEENSTTTAGTGTGTIDSTGTGMVPGALPATPANPGGVLPTQPGTAPAANPGSVPAAVPSGTTQAPKSTPRKGRPRLKNIKLKKFDWPEEVDAATRAKAEEYLDYMLEQGGREADEGEEWFIKQGRKMGGRLISEFIRIHEQYGFDRQGNMRFMILDRTLSQIDGTVERKWNSRQRISHVTSEAVAMGRLKRWTSWWDQGLWKTDPIEPWDPRKDEVDPEAKKTKEDEKGREFGKRAGK